MRVLDRVERQLSQLSNMMEQRGASFEAGDGYVLQNRMKGVLIRCIFCRNSQTCREWLQSDRAERGYPGFCPNAGFIDRYRRPENHEEHAPATA